MTNSTLTKIYNNIKKYRHKKSFTQAQLAELTDTSEDYISLIENGKRTPSVKRLIIIAKALEIEPYELLQ